MAQLAGWSLLILEVHSLNPVIIHFYNTYVAVTRKSLLLPIKIVDVKANHLTHFETTVATFPIISRLMVDSVTRY